VIENIIDISKITSFYKQLFKKVVFTTLIVIALSLSYVFLVGVEAKTILLPAVIVGLSLIKTVFIMRLTFIQLSKIISESHRLSHVLTLFSVLILLIIFSFSFDYHALYAVDSNSFKSSLEGDNSVMRQSFEFIYFSLVTFSSVGFGDVVPISVPGKMVVLLEVFLSFFVLIFGIANINRIHINK